MNSLWKLWYLYIYSFSYFLWYWVIVGFTPTLGAMAYLKLHFLVGSTLLTRISFFKWSTMCVFCIQTIKCKHALILVKRYHTFNLRKITSCSIFPVLQILYSHLRGRMNIYFIHAKPLLGLDRWSYWISSHSYKFSLRMIIVRILKSRMSYYIWPSYCSWWFWFVTTLVHY